MFLTAIFFLLVFGFAIFGVVVFLRELFGSSNNSPGPDVNRPTRDMADDAIGACHLLNHLYSEKQITTESYKRIRAIVELRFGSMANLPGRMQLREDEPEVAEAEFTAATKFEEPDIGTPEIAESIPAMPEGAVSPTPVAEPFAMPVAEPVAPTVPAAPAPWEMPDPPPPTPRRSFNDVLAAFMQEKNIRWGELASGILIVGSAVGLVVSLRNELTRTIPYFPALLFLLITAGIHAAGSYTLKKWKLRKTSRGTLLIGLLLVPLNFLAACILSGSEQLRRPLDDPLYWTAIIFGCGAFGVMTWWSSRLLLKRGHWPMVFGVMGAAVSTLVINRLEWVAGSSWQVLIVTVPLAVAMFMGSGIWSRTLRSSRDWTERTLNRQYMLLGLAVFAGVTAMALVMIRATDRTFSITAIMPMVVFVSMISAWIGLVAHDGLVRSKVASQRMVSRSLTVLGMLLAVLALLFASPNPMVLMICGMVVAVVGFAIARDRKMSGLMPVVWAGSSIAVVCGANLALNKTGIDVRVSLEGMRDLFFSGHSGLSLMSLGLVIGAAYGFSRPIAGDGVATSARRLNLIAAGAIGSLGCLLALVAGLLNRDSQFDTMTASALLGIASVTALGMASYKNRTAFPPLAALTSFAFLAFTFLWNPTTSQWFASMLRGIDANLLVTFAAHGLIVAATACVASVRMPAAKESIWGLSAWSALSSVLAVLAAFWFAPTHSGISTVMMVVVTVSWLGVTWSARSIEWEHSWPTSLMIVAGLLLVVGLMDHSVRLGMEDWKQPQHWLVQATVLGVWSLVWTAGRLGFGKSVRWLFDHSQVRGEHLVQTVVLLGLMGLLGFALFEANARQLVAGFESIGFPARDHVGLCMIAVASIFASIAFSFVLRASLIAGVALTIAWCLGWSVPSLLFDESLSAGTAIRWLLSVGCVITAGIVALRKMWLKENEFGNKLDSEDSGASILNGMIDCLLTVSVGIVILVSSATVARVMLSESQVAALGGPVPRSWFARVSMEVSYGLPVGLITAAFLIFAIFQSRQWLATIGSAVYQYMVLFSIVLLYLSPHPKLATSWFLNILQAVSLGMSVYGMAWFVFRARVRGVANAGAVKPGWLSQIEIHSAINALLVTSLAVLVGGRFFSSPGTAGGWINSAGGPLGLIALAMVSGLLFLVSQDRMRERSKDSFLVWMACWFGMVLVAMVAANIDRTVAVPWIGLRSIQWGSVAMLAVVGGLAGVFQRRRAAESERSNFAGPIWITSIVALLFSIRGGLNDWPDIWQYTIAIASVVVIVTAVGVSLRCLSAQYIAVFGILAGSTLLSRVNPGGVFPNDQPGWMNLNVVLLCVLGGVWSVVHVLRRNREETARGFAALPNIMLLGAAIWVLIGGLLQWYIDSDPFMVGGGSALRNRMGLAAVCATIGLAGISLWHERVFVRVSAAFLISTGISIAVASAITTAVELENDARFLWVMFAMAATVLGWGIVLLKQSVWKAAFARWQVERIGAIENGLSIQVPVFGLLLSLVVLTSSLFTVAFIEPRSLRYLSAMTPFLLAFAFGCMSDQGSRRLFQLVSLAIVTLGFVLTGWADLPPLEQRDTGLEWLVRLVMILAGAMFFYGAVVSRWVQEGDTWLRSLREATVASGAIAVVGLLWLVVVEQSEFIVDVGCGVGVTEAWGLAVVVVGMIVGLVTVAMRPKLDPFSMSDAGRTAYVYAAQAVLVLLVCHLYFTMPWMFQAEIRQYWPYLLMALAFGGVGVAHVLKQRGLMVLSQPLFNAAAILPVLVSAGIWTIDSKADASLVLFTAGLAYLMISRSHGSILAGFAAVVFGNLALWVFYDKFPTFSFFDHPQLWLIPPAISVLVGAHLSRDRFNASQLATIRYICVAVIYVSSTCEIFIRGIGDNLWPPVVLAVLAVIGIFAGMALQVRAYLYLGSLFLLMAMITMVSHAHQRLGHVWPWWAFGIGAGMSILIMFGVFEKHRNKMKSISDKLQKWDL